MTAYKTVLLDVCVVGAAITFSLLLRRRKRQHVLPLPPGPRGLPIVGNMFQVPTSLLWEKALEWGKVYGDMIYLDIAGMPMLIVNSHEVAVDLLSKRSANYSSRPQLMMSTLGGWGWATSILPYGEALKTQRMFLHKYFQTPEVLNYKETQQTYCHIFLQGILESPWDYEKHVRRLPAAVLAMNTYGHSVETENDRYVQLGEESGRLAGESINYLFLDFFPWLLHLPKWFPGTSFHQFARASRKHSDLFRREIYALNKNKQLDGTAKESMTTLFLGENFGQDGVVADEEEFINAAATVFLGGADTSVTAIMNLVLAMLKYPDAQRRAQEEIDRVLGNNRLPSFEDREHLPYIEALCLELLRWQAIVPLAFIHTVGDDDEYRGYHIPTGTMIVPNTWAIAQDESQYPDPLGFLPERWLPGGSSFSSIRPGEYVFGYGRRICPGQVWAEHMLFIATASLLAAFNIEPALDVDGSPIPPNEKHKSAVIRLLGPSKCKITPRSEKVSSMIRECAAEAL